MTLNELIYITKVAEMGSFSEAAAELYISQPSLSQAVQKAEKRYGCEFFVRTPEGLILTPEGERYVEAAHSIIQLNRQLELDLCPPNSEYKRTIYCGTNFNQGDYFFPQVYTRFKEKYPNIRINLIEDQEYSLEKKLLSGAIDFAVTRLPFKNQNSIEYTILGKEHFVLVANRNHPITQTAYAGRRADFPYVDLDACRDELFILPPPNIYVRSVINRMFDKTDFVPQTIMEIRSFALQCDLCEVTPYLAIVPYNFSQRNYSKDVVFFNIEEKYSVPYLLVLAKAAGRKLSQPTRELIKLILKNNALSQKEELL